MPTHHLIFDVNETLLDLSPLDAVFSELFEAPSMRRVWFASMLHWSTVTTLTGRYRDFGELAGNCLDALAQQQQKPLSDANRQRVFDTIAKLAPHPDVAPALHRLEENGFTLVALTNSAQKTVDAQFANAGLTDHFVHVLSVDRARCFKPHPKAYAVAADALGCELAKLRLIAAHDWDVTGAMRAGCAAAFVARGNAVLNPAGERPDVIGQDLSDVAEQLIARDPQ